MPTAVGTKLDRRGRDRVRRRAAFATAIVGVLDVVSGTTPPLANRLHEVRGWVPFTVPQASAMLVTAEGLALVLLAGGMRRGQRRAWLLSVVLLCASAVLHVVKGLDVEEAVVALGLAAYLGTHRDCFPAESCPQRTRTGLSALVVGASSAMVAGTIAVLVTERPDGTHPPLGWAIAATAERLVGIRRLDLAHRLDSFLAPSLAAVGIVVFVSTAWLLLRPIVHRGGQGAPIDPKVRELVLRHARDSLSYFALRNDKSHFVTGESVVAYSIINGVCLVSPDPIGPEADRAATWASFRNFAEDHGWPVAVLGASSEWLPVYEADEMSTLYVGDEAVVDLDRFSLAGHQGKGLRHAMNRAETAGYTFEMRDATSIEPELEESLRHVLAASRRGGVERGYAMTLGRVFQPADRGVVVGIAFEPSGEPAAFCQFVPAPGINGWSLDLSRRSDRPHPNSISDFAIVSSALALRDWGASAVTLNFSVLRAVLAGEAEEDGWFVKLQGFLGRKLSSTMQIESLWKHNAKYRPSWNPRFAVWDGAEHVVPAAIACAQAEALWELPVIGRFFHREVPEGRHEDPVLV